MSKKNLSTQVVTPEAVACYVKLNEPAETLSGDLKYSLTLAFPKDANLADLQAAIKNAITKKWGDDQAKWPKNLKLPLRDGSEKEDSWWHDKVFLNAGCDAKRRPQIVTHGPGGQIVPITDPSEIYSGMIVRAAIGFFPFDRAGNRGVGAGLNHVFKVRDGERLDGIPKAEDVFGGLAKELAGSETSAGGDSLDFLNF